MDNGNGTDEDDYFVNGNGKTHTMAALEIEDEEEADSLIRETADIGLGRSAFMANRLTFRKTAAKIRQPGDGDGQSHFHLFRGFLREGVGSQFSFRNFAVLASLGFLMLILLDVLNRDLEHDVPQDTIQKPPHKSSFGGSKNPGHYQQPSFTLSDDEDDFYFIDDDKSDDNLLPKSNVGDAIISVSRDNIQNANGHYLHDPIHSPFASPLYKQNSDATVQEAAQKDYEERMQQVISKWGQWTSLDTSDVVMPDYSAYESRDIPSADFPEHSWQRNKDYLKDFLGHGKDLVERVKQGIYAEYGYDSSTLTGADLQEMRYKQDEFFSVIVYEYDDKNVKIVKGQAVDEQTGQNMPGIAHMNTRAWEGLVRKLLHAVMTSEDFFVVAVGPASTYRGNNFHQSQVMQFNQIMEPVLDKLGIRLLSRNMGMDASTTISALGGKSVFGEADILWYVPDPRPEAYPESAGQLDLLHRQAILSGERMPLILTPTAAHMEVDTNGRAWLGNIQQGASLCGETYVRGGTLVMPDVPACQYLRCTDETKHGKHGGYCEKHNSVCWVERTNWNPDIQDSDVGYQTGGYANHQEHQWEGRKLTLLVLHALEEALDRWGTEMAGDRLPLADNLWHVGPTYKELRESVRTLEPKAGKSSPDPPCYYLLRHLHPMICHLSMHAITEWTPRVTPVANRLKAAVVEGIADENSDKVELYTEVNLLPVRWKVPSEQVDVHMIAIATNDTSELHDKPSSDLVTDDFFFDDDGAWIQNEDDDDDNTDDYNGERRMMLQSQKGWVVYNAPIGFCDGSAQSRCNRIIGNPCLLANYNHYKAGILGHGGSDWLTMNVGVVKEGIILGRFDFGGDVSIPDLPSDFLFEYSVAGNVTSLSRNDFTDSIVQIVSDLWVFPFLIDREMSHTVNESEQIVVVAIRVSSSVANDLIRLTHIYYA